MKRTITFLATAVLVLAAAPIFAATTAAVPLAVSADVAGTCSLTTTAVSFATAYDPVVANATAGADLTGTGAIEVACTRGLTPTVALTLGGNASGSVRRLKNGTDYLAYELYHPDGVTVWGSAGTALLSVTADNAAHSYTVNATIVGGQNAMAGTYTDSVDATVNY